jgi:hypothetical protein
MPNDFTSVGYTYLKILNLPSDTVISDIPTYNSATTMSFIYQLSLSSQQFLCGLSRKAMRRFHFPNQLRISVKCISYGTSGRCFLLVTVRRIPFRPYGFTLRTSSHEAHAYRAGPKQVRAPGGLIIWRPFKPIFFKLFLIWTGLAKLFECACPNFGQFSEKVFRVCKPEFTGTYFRIFQWRLSAPCKLPPWVGARQARSFIRS